MINFQNPNTGLIGDKFDERDFIATGDDTPLGGGVEGMPSPLVSIRKNGKQVDLEVIPPSFQGKGTVSCTAFGGKHLLENQIAILKKDKRFWLNGNTQWEQQKIYPDTWIENVGDYMNAPLKSLKRQPLSWYNPDTKQMESWGLGSYKVADVSLWKQYAKMGYLTLTGGRFARNPVDKNGYLRFGTAYGHCITGCGYEDDQQRFKFLDSGFATRDGIVYVDYQEATELFRGWIGIPKQF